MTDQSETEAERTAGGMAYLAWLSKKSEVPTLGQAFEAGWAAGRAWGTQPPGRTSAGEAGE